MTTFYRGLTPQRRVLSKTFLPSTCECANLGAILAGSADEMLLAIAADEDAGLGWLRRKSMQKDFNFN